MTTTETFKISGLASADLDNALRNAMVFASKDTTLPVLNAVHMVVRDDLLLMEATDRFRMVEIDITQKNGEVRSEIDLSQAGEFSAVIPVDKVKALLPWLKSIMSNAYGNQLLDLTIENGILSVDSPTAGSMVIELHGGQFPGITRLFREPNDPRGTGDYAPVQAFNPAFLADLGKVKDYRLKPSARRDLTLQLHAPKLSSEPTMFTYGWDVRGLLMPVRIHS